MAYSKYFKITQYEVGKYPKDELWKVQELFSQAFGGRTLSRDMLKWQMEENPCLRERAISLWNGETLVAYNAYTPFPAIFKGEEIVAAVSGTTMGNKDFPGTSVQLAVECDRQNSDIKLKYGFPNHNFFRITKKYLSDEFKYIGDIAFWVASAQKRDVSPTIRQFHAFSNEFETISRELAKEHEFIKIRNKDFLNWRFFQKPGCDYKGFAYEKRGYIVADIYIENGVRQLQVVDILADSEEVMAELLTYAVNLAYEWDCNVVKLWLTSKRYEDVLKQQGFIYGEHPFAMNVHGQNLNLNISGSYITMGDSDIF